MYVYIELETENETAPLTRTMTVMYPDRLPCLRIELIYYTVHLLYTLTLAHHGPVKLASFASWCLGEIGCIRMNDSFDRNRVGEKIKEEMFPLIVRWMMTWCVISSYFFIYIIYFFTERFHLKFTVKATSKYSYIYLYNIASYTALSDQQQHQVISIDINENGQWV